MRSGREFGCEVRAALLCVLLTAAAPAAILAQGGDLPRSSLAVETGSGWRSWWSAKNAPATWLSPHPAVASALRWRAVRPGLEQAELRLRGSGEAWRVRAIVIRIDPGRFELRLRSASSPDGLRSLWTADSISAPAALAFNAGHFDGGISWGWVVMEGRELQPPGKGSLAMALVASTDGAVRILAPDEIEAARESGRIYNAIQSYPMLLAGDGVVPEPLRQRGRGVDLDHRDSRLAVGQLRDGSIVVVLTRFEGLGGVLSALPFGLTVPEMAALMGAIGSHAAFLLDGGISGQMAVRTFQGEVTRWKGLRRVPLAVELVPSTETATAGGDALLSVHLKRPIFHGLIGIARRSSDTSGSSPSSVATPQVDHGP